MGLVHGYSHSPCSNKRSGSVVTGQFPWRCPYQRPWSGLKEAVRKCSDRKWASSMSIAIVRAQRSELEMWGQSMGHVHGHSHESGRVSKKRSGSVVSGNEPRPWPWLWFREAIRKCNYRAMPISMVLVGTEEAIKKGKVGHEQLDYRSCYH